MKFICMALSLLTAGLVLSACGWMPEGRMETRPGQLDNNLYGRERMSDWRSGFPGRTPELIPPPAPEPLHPE